MDGVLCVPVFLECNGSLRRSSLRSPSGLSSTKLQPILGKNPFDEGHKTDLLTPVEKVRRLVPLRLNSFIKISFPRS